MTRKRDKRAQEGRDALRAALASFDAGEATPQDVARVVAAARATLARLDAAAERNRAAYLARIKPRRQGARAGALAA